MKQKGKALRWFGVFLVFMLVCGIVSRGIYAQQMPRVKTAVIQTKMLNHKVEGEGVVEAKQEMPFTLPPGLLVAGVCVRQGQKVEQGDVLLYLDMDSLEKMYREKQQELDLAKTRLSDYKAGVAAEEKDRQTNLNRANEDYNNTKNETDSDLAGANQAYQDALDALKDFPSLKKYKKQKMEEDKKYRKLQEAAQNLYATEEDRQALKDYKSQLESTLESQYKEEKQSLEEARAQREAELSALQKEQGEKMAAAGRALEDAKKPEAAEVSAELELEQAADRIEEECGIYKSYLDAQGAVTAQEESYVSRILVEAGGITAESGVMVLSTIGETLFFTGNITKEDKKYVTAGDAMSISFGSSRFLSDIPVIAIGETEDGGYKVTAEISSEGRSIGENGSFSLVRQTESYSGCVPLSALRTENYEDFVYYIEEQETILGTELVVKKRKVKVVDKDEEFAALEGSPFTEEEKLIIDADKEFNPGSRVRMEE